MEMLFSNNRCCEAVWSAILATAWLLVFEHSQLVVVLAGKCNTVICRFLLYGDEHGTGTVISEASRGFVTLEDNVCPETMCMEERLAFNVA